MKQLHAHDPGKHIGHRFVWKIAFLVLVIASLNGCALANNEPVVSCGLCYGGLPLGATDEVFVNTGYIVGYSDTRQDPLWVSYHVFAVSNPVSDERPSRFRTDTRTVAQVSHDDYTYSGYDRGHMAPNAAIDYCYGQEAQLETFYMSNVCPQMPTLNRGIWATLESKVRGWTNAFQKVWVMTGPIFDNDIETLTSGVEIPDAFYKIVIREVNGLPRVLSFVIPQEAPAGANLSSYLTSVDAVEQDTGFDFLSNIPGFTDDIEEAMESEIPTQLWPSTSASEPSVGKRPSPTATQDQPTPLSANVRITRIFYDGAVPRVESDEYVEITNYGQRGQDLRGWTLVDISDGHPSFCFGNSYILAPGASIRVYTNEIHPEWGGFSFGYGRAIWSNKDPDTAALYNSLGQEVSRKTY